MCAKSWVKEPGQGQPEFFTLRLGGSQNFTFEMQCKICTRSSNVICACIVLNLVFSLKFSVRLNTNR